MLGLVKRWVGNEFIFYELYCPLEDSLAEFWVFWVFAGYGLLDQKRTFMSTNGISENRGDLEKSFLKLRLTWLILLLLLLTLAENRNICLGVILFLVGNTTLWFQSSVTRWLGIECTTITWRMLSVVFRLRASPLCILVTVWTIARSYRAWVLRH